MVISSISKMTFKKVRWVLHTIYDSVLRKTRSPKDFSDRALAGVGGSGRGLVDLFILKFEARHYMLGALFEKINSLRFARPHQHIQNQTPAEWIERAGFPRGAETESIGFPRGAVDFPRVVVNQNYHQKLSK